MANFNTKSGAKKTKTFEGGDAFKRTPKQDLFIASISDFVSGDSFYEGRGDKNSRLVSLTQKVTKQDPQWVANFVKWLRNDANLRSVSILVGVEAAVAASGGPVSGRQILAGAMSRADEPGEVLAYWNSTRPGKSLPAAIKRAVADGAKKLYNEYSVAKYDSNAREFRFGDVINLTHPKPEGPKQEQVFKLALDRRYNNKTLTGSSLLSMQRDREEFMSMSDDQKIAIIQSENGSAVLKAAGLTWENVLSTVKGEKSVLWEALIPTMGYMALLRNLRNFEAADISAETWSVVYSRLADAEEVSRSRQLPFRFLSAYKNVSSSHHKLRDALETAVSHSLGNIDTLPGKTLLFIDLSGSMYWSHLSANSTANLAESASLFGYAMAKKSQKADLVAFGSTSKKLSVPKNFEGILHKVENIQDLGGTSFDSALSKWYVDGEYDRVIVVTDEQFNYGYSGSPYKEIKSAEAYVWNLAGYEPSSVSGQSNVHQMGGLSAESFKIINLIEAGQKGNFPWE